VGCGISMLCFASYMYQNVTWTEAGQPALATWFPIMSLFVFYACSTIGYLIVPWVMIGEVFPRQIRGMLGGVATCVGHFSIFIVLQTYPLLQELVGKSGTFAVYGVVSILSTIFFYYFCPETKNKTLQEIEESFCSKKKPKRPVVLNVNATATATVQCNNNKKLVFPDIVFNLPKRETSVIV